MIFSCENPDPDNRRFMDLTGVECRAHIAKVTVPLFTEQFGKTFVCGSGVLLQISEKGFIVSAGHTFDARKIANLPLWVTNGVVDSKLLPLGEVTIRSSATNAPVDRTDEPYDIAVCELPAKTTAQIVGEKQFLRLIDVDPWDRQDPRSWYKVFGFPTALSPADEAAKRVPSDAVALATFLYRDERGPLDRFEPDVGIAVDFDMTNMRADDGSPAVPPHPGGMSGCAPRKGFEPETGELTHPIGLPSLSSTAMASHSLRRISVRLLKRPNRRTTTPWHSRMCLLHRKFRHNIQGRALVTNSFIDGYPASRKTWTAG